MKDQAILRQWFIQARDGESLLITARVAAANGHDGAADTGVDVYLYFVEPLLRHRPEKRHQVILQPGHYHLRLRIAHPAIIFNDIRLIADLDNSDKYKSLVV